MGRRSAEQSGPALLRGTLIVFLAVACGSTVDTVGYNASGVSGGAGGAGGEAFAGTPTEAGAGGDAGAAGAGAAGGVTLEGGAGGVPTGGTAGTGGVLGTGGLRPLTGPATYPNVFKDVLGKTDLEIANKLSKTYEQLFHGDPASEAVYYELDDDTAYIRDTLHDDVRTEGIGHGMIITVELDKREEFDKLWRYADSKLKVTTGPNAGYFRSRCQGLTVLVEDCLDPYGLQQMLMALIFAHGRWRSDTGAVNYELAALELFDLMRNKEEMNGGIVDGVTNTFDTETKLVFDLPNASAASYTRPSVEMPAFYELWAQATGDSFYADAAAAARSYWKRAEHPETGLLPSRAYFDGKPVEGWGTFEPEGYRASYSVALDRIWFKSDAWHVEHSDRMIAFFDDIGINVYGRVYSLDGMLLQGDREPSLVASNGPVAMLATHAASADFIEAVWNLPIPIYDPRYYNGTMQLLALITMAGQYRVY